MVFLVNNPKNTFSFLKKHPDDAVAELKGWGRDGGVEVTVIGGTNWGQVEVKARHW